MPLEFNIINYNSPEYQKALRLREDVMRKPLGLLLSEEDVKDDGKRIHISEDIIMMSSFANDELICGCSLRIIHHKIAHIYSVFVKQELQNKGFGQRLMAYAENYAKSQGAKRLYVEGRKAAKNFYQKCGFSSCGLEYIDMNIVHQDMRKDIA